MTSGTPPARNTWIVGWCRGPFGSASTMRGTRRLMSVQSRAVGRRRPAACAIAGQVQDQVRRAAKRRVRHHRVVHRGVGQDVFHPDAASARAPSARGRTVAPCPARWDARTGASAEWPSDMPSASPITCDVAAVPRNWQPPPGEAQARHPSSDASSSESSPCTKRTPIVCTRPASSPSTGRSVTPPGTSTQGRSWLPASAIIIAGRPLSHVATPRTPLRVGSDRISRRKTVAASLR